MAKPTRKNLAIDKVYLKAAELLFIKRRHREIPLYGCRAIRVSGITSGCGWDRTERLVLVFGNFFRGRKHSSMVWWKEYVRVHTRYDYNLTRLQLYRRNMKLVQNHKLLTQRTIALCLMAELAKDGQLDV